MQYMANTKTNNKTLTFKKMFTIFINNCTFLITQCIIKVTFARQAFFEFFQAVPAVIGKNSFLSLSNTSALNSWLRW